MVLLDRASEAELRAELERRAAKKRGKRPTAPKRPSVPEMPKAVLTYSLPLDHGYGEDMTFAVQNILDLIPKMPDGSPVAKLSDIKVQVAHQQSYDYDSCSCDISINISYEHLNLRLEEEMADYQEKLSQHAEKLKAYEAAVEQHHIALAAWKAKGNDR